ncbi:MAG: flavin reductase family protein [Calditrichaeota bacterium]|nr:flavin reductase family protein [Calditrichota bacterium]MBT7616702.1 flavin reductase family protein [Calditrichota bacterium]MBT7787808.1 flavin reductase family protein [Calditrichota bacterium]
MKHIVINPHDLEPREIHKLLLGIIIPRPIGLISTISAKSGPNLAPFSFFQAISANPPTLLFCPTRDRNGGIKHTHGNVIEIGEFVANVVTEKMATAMNISSGDFPENISEFESAGFTPLKSDKVKPFRVAESPVNLECRVIKIVEVSEEPLGGAVIIGEILRFHINEEVFDPENKMINPEKFDLISRLGGMAYAPIRERFDMSRPILSTTSESNPDDVKKSSESS